MKSNRSTLKILSIASALAFLVVIVVNALANALPLNGVTTGQLSDEIPNLFVPAGLTFSIWGLIYLLLAGYVIYAIREAWDRGEGEGWTSRDALLFLLNAAANVGWIFAWQWRLVGLSMGIMLMILGTLIALELSIEHKMKHGGALSKTASNSGTPENFGAPTGAGESEVRAPARRVRRFFLSVPIRVYLGWISVATIANATALLVKLGWNGWGIDPRIWTVIVIAAGLAVALGFSVGQRQIAAPLVVVWAYLGIVIKRVGTDAAYSRAVWIAALVALVVIVGSIGMAQARRSR